MKKKILNWLEHNRFTVIVPVIGIFLWLAAYGCEPTTISPMTGTMVNARQLQVEYNNYINKFEYAVEDLQIKAERQQKFIDILITLASGEVASASGLLTIILGSGVLGLAADNARKSGVIGGLKKTLTDTGVNNK